MRFIVPFFFAVPGFVAATSINPNTHAGRALMATCPTKLIAPADSSRGSKLRGSVRSMEGKPLEFANVLLLRAGDSSLVKAGLSDEQGRFTFADVLPGAYRLRARQMGYRDGRSAVVQVLGGATLPETLPELPPLVLAPAARQLGEVRVTGRPPVIERLIDRTVVHVDQLPAVAGGSAYDLIKSAPGVTVTAGDDISMQGKSGVLVLIDDRPVRLSQEALLNMLRNMPAESVQALEIITTPPARYDAEGNAGILNLRTRQRRQPGWNVDLTGRGARGRYGRYGGGAVVGIKHKVLDLNGSYFLGRTRSFEEITQYATQRGPGPARPAELRSASLDVPTARYHDAKAQLDLKTGPKSSAGLVANAYWLANPSQGTATIQALTGAIVSDTTGQTQSRRDNSSSNYSVDGYYMVRLDSVGKSLSIDANYARFRADQQQDFTNQTFFQPLNQALGSPQQLRSQLAGNTRIQSLKADLTLPLPGCKLEVGAKYSRVLADNDFRFEREQSGGWLPDNRRGNQFEYQESISAAYASVSKDWAKVSLQLGLRGEYTRTLGVSGTTQSTTQTSNRNNYFRLFPTVYVQYKLPAGRQLNLSYSRRIERPAYGSLNPFLFFQSQYFSNQGNPFLQPSFTDAVEWTAVFKHDLSVAPFFNYTSQFSSEYPLQNLVTRETTYTFGNLGYSYNYGVTVVAPFSLGKRWKVDNNLTVYSQTFQSTYAAEPQRRQLWVYNLSVTNSFTFSPHLTAQLSGYYNSPTVQGFYRSASYYALNAGLTLKLLDNKANFSVNLADMLYTERGAADIQYANQDFGFYRRNDTRLLRLALTYKLGNTGLAKKSQREGAGQEERNRAN